MPQRDSAPIGAPCWIDLFTSDPEKSQAVLRRAVRLDGRRGRRRVRRLRQLLEGRRAGRRLHAQRRSTGTPDVWSVYLASDDAEATVEAAVAHGGQVIVPGDGGRWSSAPWRW